MLKRLSHFIKTLAGRVKFIACYAKNSNFLSIFSDFLLEINTFIFPPVCHLLLFQYVLYTFVWMILFTCRTSEHWQLWLQRSRGRCTDVASMAHGAQCTRSLSPVAPAGRCHWLHDHLPTATFVLYSHNNIIYNISKSQRNICNCFTSSPLSKLIIAIFSLGQIIDFIIYNSSVSFEKLIFDYVSTSKTVVQGIGINIRYTY